MIRLYFVRSLPAIAAAMALYACEAPAPLGPHGALNEIITRLSSDDGSTAATYHTGAAPAAGAAAAPSAPAAGSSVNGGSALIPLSAGSAFTTVVVSIEGVDGYYELSLPTAASASDVVLGIAAVTGEGTLPVRVAVGTDGAVGAYAAQDLSIHHAGTGDVQISVSWSGASDVDLRVTDPSGELIAFANPASASGGKLDLDSNSGCTIDGINSENVVWPAGHAPRGSYHVTVVYYDDCSVARSDYVVTIAMAGHETQVLTGSFVGQWEANSDKDVGSFTY